MSFEHLSQPEAPILVDFHREPFIWKRGELVSGAPYEVLFGPFRLSPTRYLLLEGDRPVPLGSRGLEILTALLERPDELVTKQELMARVWPNTFVEPANLTVHISTLRRMLRDGTDGNRFIINVPGRGYSFVAPVEHRNAEVARNHGLSGLHTPRFDGSAVNPAAGQKSRFAASIRLPAWR